MESNKFLFFEPTFNDRLNSMGLIGQGMTKSQVCVCACVCACACACACVCPGQRCACFKPDNDDNMMDIFVK